MSTLSTQNLIQQSATAALCTAVIVCTTSVNAIELSSVGLSTNSDSNPTKAQQKDDIEATSAVHATIDITLGSVELNDESALFFDAQGDFANNKIAELGESTISVGASYFRQMEALGEPLLSVRGDITYLDSETDMRDSNILGLTLAASWEPSPFYDYTLGTRLSNRSANSAVFSTNNITMFGQYNYYFSETITLSTGLSYQMGNVVSTATPTLNVVNTASLIEPDDAFGGLESRRFAYLLDANSLILDVGGEIALSDSLFGNFSFQSITTKAENPIEYKRNLIALSVKYLF